MLRWLKVQVWVRLFSWDLEYLIYYRIIGSWDNSVWKRWPPEVLHSKLLQPAALSSWVLKMSKDRDCTSCLANLIHHLSAFKGEKFLYGQSDSHISSYAHPHTPCTAVKNLFLSSSKPCSYEKVAIRSSWNHLSSRLKKANSLNLYSKNRWTWPPWWPSA